VKAFDPEILAAGANQTRPRTIPRWMTNCVRRFVQNQKVIGSEKYPGGKFVGSYQPAPVNRRHLMEPPAAGKIYRPKKVAFD